MYSLIVYNEHGGKLVNPDRLFPQLTGFVQWVGAFRAPDGVAQSSEICSCRHNLDIGTRRRRWKARHMTAGRKAAPSPSIPKAAASRSDRGDHDIGLVGSSKSNEHYRQTRYENLCFLLLKIFLLFSTALQLCVATKYTYRHEASTTRETASRYLWTSIGRDAQHSMANSNDGIF
jgi:hypothetical protein